MRTMQERRIRHVTQMKTKRKLNRSNKRIAGSEGIIKDPSTKKLYKQISDGNQRLYIELKTSKG